MSKEAMKLALEALEELTVTERTSVDIERGEKAITALQEALAEQPAQQEAQIVRWNCPCGNKYTFHGFTKAPPQRTWVGLTDEEITDIWAGTSPYYHEDDFAKAIEAKLRERNT